MPPDVASRSSTVSPGDWPLVSGPEGQLVALGRAASTDVGGKASFSRKNEIWKDL